MEKIIKLYLESIYEKYKEKINNKFYAYHCY